MFARVRLDVLPRGCASGGHGQSTSKGFLPSKRNWNKSNERKYTFTFNECAQPYFGVKVSVPTVSTVSFDFS